MQPYILQGKHYSKKVIIALLLILSVLSFSLINYLTFMIGVLGLYFFVMIPFVRFKNILVFQDRFEIQKSSIFKWYTNKETFFFNDLKQVYFSESQTDWLRMALGTRIYTERISKGDTMNIVLKNGDYIEINRIGNRKDFVEMITFIKKQLGNTKK